MVWLNHECVCERTHDSKIIVRIACAWVYIAYIAVHARVSCSHWGARVVFRVACDGCTSVLHVSAQVCNSVIYFSWRVFREDLENHIWHIKITGHPQFHTCLMRRMRMVCSVLGYGCAPNVDNFEVKDPVRRRPARRCQCPVPIGHRKYCEKT